MNETTAPYAETNSAIEALDWDLMRVRRQLAQGYTPELAAKRAELEDQIRYYEGLNRQIEAELAAKVKP